MFAALVATRSCRSSHGLQLLVRSPIAASTAATRTATGFCRRRRLLLSSFETSATAISPFHSSTICRLNRFLFDPDEVEEEEVVDDGGGRVVRTATLPSTDYRAVHASKILGLRTNDTVRAGIVGCNGSNNGGRGGLMTDVAVVEWTTTPGGDESKKNGPPGALRIRLESLEPAPESLSASPVSLILALPRPLQLGRMLPMISQMGVEKLILTGARKVPKDYFGSHLLREPDQLTDRLIEGLCQAGDVRLPELRVERNLSKFLNEDLDDLFPEEEYARVVAHPERVVVTANDDDDDDGSNSIRKKPKRMRDVDFPTNGGNNNKRKIVVAVGPEGGWEEPREIDRFVAGHGFQQVTLGTRVLRSDCAVVSLLSLANDACSE